MATHDPIKVTLNLRGKIYLEDAIEYSQNQGFIGGHSVGPAGVEAVERKLRDITGNQAKVCHGNALVWFRSSRPEKLVTFDEMWSEMQKIYGLNPVGKNHPDQYGRSDNWLKTSAVLESML